MADPRFFNNAGPFTLGDLARFCHARLINDSDADYVITDVAPLDRAQATELSFLDNRKYRDQFALTGAGACLVHEDHVALAPEGCRLLIAEKPYHAYARTAQKFYPDEVPVHTLDRAIVHPAAHIDATARIGDCCQIAAGVVIGRQVEIGPNTVIDANTVIGDGVVIGSHCRIGACVSISHAIIGQHVRLFPGVRIGQDGFGYAMDASGHIKVPQLGRVIIEDAVEIGANSTIDRGAGPDTVIGRGVIIDNLVQIGHNVQIGAGSVLVAQSGIAGSSRLGRFSVIAAQGGVAGHITIGDGGIVGAQAGVMRDVDPGQTVMGSPAMPVKSYWRQVASLERLTRKKEG